ncbi:cold-shock protein [Francisella endosymbiont of Ornithodoros moubata]|uniref:cold-shock protein n=1 Tax=Francisella-like endosymbiont TaxID=512373 RepID=UPI000A256EDE|nr:cold-shock protein [Francisella endosymbiont of Ornithodoros moubata]
MQPQDGGKDVFVHINEVESAGLSSLREGEKVGIETEENKGKIAAILILNLIYSYKYL